MPTTELTPEQLTDGKIGVIDLMLACGLIASRGEGRRLIQQNGVTADDEKIANLDVSFTAEQLKAGIKLRKGKKIFHKAILKN
jgi:tyrosyl-tRNA synthetase